MISPPRSSFIAYFVLVASAACATSEAPTFVPAGAAAAPEGGSQDASSGDASASSPPAIPESGIVIPATPQRSGDPARGYKTLVNGGYLSLGIPWSGFSFAMSDLDSRDALTGREGKNALVGYSYNVSTNSSGVEIASPNCLSCHATHLQGKLIIGLGRAAHSLALPSGTATNPALITLGLSSAAELSEYQTFGTRLLITQDSGTLLVFGALASHRNPATLEWSNAKSFSSATGLSGWVDVPPWWRTKKKHGLYATGMGRGDQVRHMMNMTVFSADSVAEAQAIDAMFVDVAAFLRSIEPPKYPGPIDASLATQGEQVFMSTCATCHGTYGAKETYPNLLFPVTAIGTDPELAQKQWVTSAAVDWFASSFYGSGGAAMLEPLPGYVAPPLDGIWATAPFFHNGSVPTLEGVLDSTKRPETWRSSFGDDDYDLDAVGWKTATGIDVYSTLLPGLSNGGHTFGDALSGDDRRALLEYLKTL